MADTSNKQKRTTDKRLLVGLGVLAVAVILIIIGLFQGDALTVFRKAILICYECIGIG